MSCIDTCTYRIYTSGCCLPTENMRPVTCGLRLFPFVTRHLGTDTIRPRLGERHTPWEQEALNALSGSFLESTIECGFIVLIARYSYRDASVTWWLMTYDDSVSAHHRFGEFEGQKHPVNYTPGGC